MRLTILLLAVMGCGSRFAAAQVACDDAGQTCVSGQQPWGQTVVKMLNEFKQCKDPVDDISPCNYFAARALEAAFGITDFKTPAGYLVANEIAAWVKTHPDIWTSLGPATEQSALTEAQGSANIGRAVIAVATGDPGHVAIVLPGKVFASPSWSAKVPCSASFFLKKPATSYVGCPLSHAFKLPAGVTLYGRNY